MGDAPVAQPKMADITLWADHGRDFYAPIAFANLPTQPWRGQQSSPRDLDLVTTPHGLRLRQRVAEEVRALLAIEALLRLQEVSVQAASAALSAKLGSGGGAAGS